MTDRLAHRLIVAEAACILTITNAFLRVVPFRTAIGWTGGSPVVSSDPSEAESHGVAEPLAAQVGLAVKSAEARLPWKSKCLVQAFAARLMLMRRGVRSTLILGVAKETGDIRAHAWLLAGGGIVCGGRQASRFTPIASFRDL